MQMGAQQIVNPFSGELMRIESGRFLDLLEGLPGVGILANVSHGPFAKATRWREVKIQNSDIGVPGITLDAFECLLNLMVCTFQDLSEAILVEHQCASDIGSPVVLPGGGQNLLDFLTNCIVVSANFVVTQVNQSIQVIIHGDPFR